MPCEQDGITVRSFLRGTCRISARLHRKLKQVENGITVDGRLVKARDVLKGGDMVVLHIPDEDCVEAVSMPVDIVYEDDYVIVLNKPANMPVHPTHGHGSDTLANAVAAYLPNVAFRPVNRLDRDTTGLVLAAKDSFSAVRLQESAEKIYYAVCTGRLEGQGTIDKPIRVKEGHGIQREVGDGGERSITHWKALASNDEMTLVECRLETGRTHQIRVHFSSYMKMPLLGDDMYGGSRKRISRQALHCGFMAFIHPMTKKRIELTCPPPEDMMRLSVCAEYFARH